MKVVVPWVVVVGEGARDTGDAHRTGATLVEHTARHVGTRTPKRGVHLGPLRVCVLDVALGADTQQKRDTDHDEIHRVESIAADAVVHLALQSVRLQ